MGIAFLVAVWLLLATGTVAALRPTDRRAALAAAVLLGGLIAGYAASRTSGIPVLSPDPEEVDAVGVATVLVEVFGLALALAVIRPTRHRPRRSAFQEV